MTYYKVLEGYDPNRGECDYDQFFYAMFTLAYLKKCKVIVETGLGFGGSTRIWLEALSRLPNPQDRILHTFDLDEPVFHGTAEKIEALKFPAKWTLHILDSKKGGLYLNQSIDLLYLDSDHQYSTVMAELGTFEQWLKPDAVIMAHDACPASEHASFTHGLGNPSDTYLALRDWGEPKGYDVLLYTHPNGMTLLSR